MRPLWGLSLLLISSVTGIIWAETPAENAKADSMHMARLQRGGLAFMNYCSGCHSLKYLRYSQMAKELELTSFDSDADKSLLYSNLVVTKAVSHDPIRIALKPQDALQWFGAKVPDLSLLVRQRGADWLRQYLKSFYRDDARPFGSNNLVVPMVAMPNVLEILSGVQVLAPDGSLSIQQTGLMSPKEFDAFVSDLAEFLAYVSEPEKTFRQHLGYIVLAFLGLLTAVLYFLKRDIWRDLTNNPTHISSSD